jgi:hypothetical protein
LTTNPWFDFSFLHSRNHQPPRNKIVLKKQKKTRRIPKLS